MEWSGRARKHPEDEEFAGGHGKMIDIVSEKLGSLWDQTAETQRMVGIGGKK